MKHHHFLVNLMSSVRINNVESRKNVKEKTLNGSVSKRCSCTRTRTTHRVAALSAARCLLHLAVPNVAFWKGRRPLMTSADGSNAAYKHHNSACALTRLHNKRAPPLQDPKMILDARNRLI